MEVDLSGGVVFASTNTQNFVVSQTNILSESCVFGNVSNQAVANHTAVAVGIQCKWPKNDILFSSIPIITRWKTPSRRSDSSKNWCFINKARLRHILPAMEVYVRLRSRSTSKATNSRR